MITKYSLKLNDSLVWKYLIWRARISLKRETPVRTREEKKTEMRAIKSTKSISSGQPGYNIQFKKPRGGNGKTAIQEGTSLLFGITIPWKI